MGARKPPTNAPVLALVPGLGEVAEDLLLPGAAAAFVATGCAMGRGKIPTTLPIELQTVTSACSNTSTGAKETADLGASLSSLATDCSSKPTAEIATNDTTSQRQYDLL